MPFSWLRAVRPSLAVPSRRCRLTVEHLEARDVPAVLASYSDHAYAVGYDSAGNVYSGGSFRGQVDFDPGPAQSWLQGGDTSESYEYRGNPYLAAYSGTGGLLWARKLSDVPGSVSDISAYTDAGGTHVYAVYSQVPNSPGEANSRWLASFAADGTLNWEKRLPSLYASSIAAASDGSVYFSAEFSGSLDVDGNPVTPDLVADGQDLFVAKWDTTGTFQWARQLGGSGDQTGDPSAIAVGAGAIYIAGGFASAFRVDGGPDLFTGQGTTAEDGFLLGLDPADGQVLSAFQYLDRPWTQAAADDTAVYLKGNAGGLYLARVSPTDGSFGWLKSVFIELEPSTAMTPMFAVADGGVYLTGLFNGTDDFDPSPTGVFNMTALGSSEIFIEKLSAEDGSFQWAKQAGGTVWYSNADELGLDVAAGGGSVYSAGFFSSRDTDFDPGPGAEVLNADGDRDGYVWKLTSAGTFGWVTRVGGQTRTLDDGDAGYTEMVSGWKSYGYGGAGGDARYHLKGNGSNKARWTITGLVPGQPVEVMVTWNAHSKNATNAPFRINGGPVVALNQRVGPDDVSSGANSYGSRNWERLGTGAADANGTVVIELSDAANGNVVADGVRVVVVPPAPLRAAGDPATGANPAPLTDAQLQPIVREAIRRWNLTGLTAAERNLLRSVTFQIADLDGATLGLAAGNTITLDLNAAGHGWFVDRTPRSDSEFRRKGDQGEQGKMDLLTAVMHELGHVLGKEHGDGAMGETLAVGTRESIVPGVRVSPPVKTAPAAPPNWFLASGRARR